MNACQTSLLALALATPMAFGAQPTAPQPDAAAPQSPSVTLTAARPESPVRVDVRAACPAIDQELQKALAPARGRVEESASTRVQFHLDGHRITEVHPSGASWTYRQQIRRAVAQLDCEGAAQAGQDFAFLLVIRSPDDLTRGVRVSMLDR